MPSDDEISEVIQIAMRAMRELDATLDTLMDCLTHDGPTTDRERTRLCEAHDRLRAFGNLTLLSMTADKPLQ